eukprot:1137869-Pelagomonas_calceolata.AAC.2
MSGRPDGLFQGYKVPKEMKLEDGFCHLEMKKLIRTSLRRVRTPDPSKTVMYVVRIGLQGLRGVGLQSENLADRLCGEDRIGLHGCTCLHRQLS